ncbi:MAG: roadblock/LC7 domain-containing protein [Desulfuromonadaceae bacterium]|nr:roadblock/LC7 domain-containing protein [Desulfuromonadaceae bacterium]
MKEILLQINNVDGVIGSALFSPDGTVIADAFPALIDATSLKQAAALTKECTHGLQISDALDLLDFRYADGRILIKTFPGAVIFLLCTNSINLKVLSITLTLAVKKLETLLQDNSPASPEPTAAGSTESDDGVLRMSISHLANKQASASFDSLGMIALSQPTSQYISTFFNTSLRKLTLVNVAAGTSGTFPVMVMKDMDRQYDGTVIVGPGIEKKLKVSEGDKVEIRIG